MPSHDDFHPQCSWVGPNFEGLRVSKPGPKRCEESLVRRSTRCSVFLGCGCVSFLQVWAAHDDLASF